RPGEEAARARLVVRREVGRDGCRAALRDELDEPRRMTVGVALPLRRGRVEPARPDLGAQRPLRTGRIARHGPILGRGRDGPGRRLVAMVRAVTKAVIPAAGMGTRFLPATKAMPKEMLPVVDK